MGSIELFANMHESENLLICRMKKFTTSLLLIFSVCSLFAQEMKQRAGIIPSDNYFQICTKADAYFAQHPAVPTLQTNNAPPFVDDEFMEYQRWKWYWHTRVDDNGNFHDISAARMNLNSNQQVANANWTNISQTTAVGGYNGMGRTTCIAFDPTDPNKFYVGAPIGGLWKTTNGGGSYTPLTDALPYVSVGSCLVDPTSPNTIYISVGDNSGWWSYSIGVYKSIDGGATWNTTGLSWTLVQGNAIAKMVMDPLNSQVIYAATTAGLYKTTNGGTSWNVVQVGDHSDLAFEPGTSNIYTATNDYWGSSEVYRSIDGGMTWIQLSTFATQYNFIRIAVTPANPAKLAVQCSDGNRPLYLSTTYGSNLAYVSDCPENAILFISPTDENKMYVGGLFIEQSVNNGATWDTLTWWYNNPPYHEVHADQHNVASNPINPDKLYFSNDGGLYHFTESTSNWGNISNGLIITQFYKIAGSTYNPMMIIGGTQDNGGRMRLNNGTWKSTNGGDAMAVAVDPTDENTIYTTYCNGVLYRSYDQWTNDYYNEISANIPGGRPNGNWVTPFVIDPSDHYSIIAGYDDVWRSADQGATWTALSNNIAGGTTLDCIAVAPSDPNTIYCSAAGVIYRTHDLGVTWTTLNPGGGSRVVTSIAIHPNNPNQLWITRAGYSGSFKVQKSINGGTTWTNMSVGLPNVSTNSCMYENGSDNLIYVATDAGVYYRDTITNVWQSYNTGLPKTSAQDLQIYYPTRKLRVATFGRGIWETDLVNPLGVQSIPTSNKTSLNVYPNPSNGIVNLNYSSTSNRPIQIRIYNVYGEEVLKIDNSGTMQLHQSIDLSTFPKGFYSISILQDERTLSQSIILN